MKKFAFLFPGQGAQYPGMGKPFFDIFPSAKRLFQEADDILSEPLSKIIFEGPEDELTKTKNSQLAIFVTSAALAKVLTEQLPEIRPAVCTGLSLGEYTALFTSGRLSFKETLLLICKRSSFMNEACEKAEGTMAAVLGMESARIETTLQGMKGVWIANYNCPGQVVISGTKEGILQATEKLKAAGAKRIIPLQVHGAFHSGLMQMAQDALAPFIQKAPLMNSPVDFVMNVPGNFVSSLEEMRAHLTAQVTHSIRWEQGILAIDAKGVDFYLEIGPGKTLAGLNKKIAPKAPTLCLETLPDLDSIAKEVLCSC